MSVVEVVGSRVLVGHVRAARAAVPWLTRAQAVAVATAVVTAHDGETTRYCVGVRSPGGDTRIYGPYATATAAEKAIGSGALALSDGDRGGVFPLIPAPKLTRAKKIKDSRK